MKTLLILRRVMRRRQAALFLLIGTLAATGAPRCHAQAASDSTLPRLEQHDAATSLIVDGKPFLIRGGELGNSSASERGTMKPHWATLASLGLNTVLVPVEWDLVEPEEGRYDFTLVDGLLEDARAHDLRLVLLWFGSWKNSMSCYVPEWLKRDQKRFPRCETSNDSGLEILSPFSEANVAADARTFAELMKHLRAVDGDRHTVIMVQVENEIGMIPEARDHSPEAEKAFAADVPAELLERLTANKDSLVSELRDRWKTTNFTAAGNWEACFGASPQTDELFMAWHFAKYTERVAAAGKAEYPLLMYVNAALPRPGVAPGAYPSAGPLPHVYDVWRAATPHIDFLAPDIYFPNFVEWVDKYARVDNPLFIPEVRASQQNAANGLYAVGAHGALGVSPFSIESIDAATASAVRDSYRILAEIEPLIVAHRGKGTMKGVALRTPFDGSEAPKTERVELGGYALTVTFELHDMWAPPSDPKTPPEASGGIIIATGPDEFLIAGTSLVITFAPASDEPGRAGIVSAQEGRFVDGKWTPGRWLNGDQTHQGRHVRIPAGTWGIQKVKLYRYE